MGLLDQALAWADNKRRVIGRNVGDLVNNPWPALEQHATGLLSDVIDQLKDPMNFALHGGGGLLGHMGHAPKGGAKGINGEWYEGGKFMPSTEAAKKAPSKFPKGGKVEVGPYEWAVRPADELQPLFGTFRDGIGAGLTSAPKGTPLAERMAERREIPEQFIRYNFPNGEGAAEYVGRRHSYVEAWNSGARYVGPDGSFYSADGTLIGR